MCGGWTRPQQCYLTSCLILPVSPHCKNARDVHGRWSAGGETGGKPCVGLGVGQIESIVIITITIIIIIILIVFIKSLWHLKVKYNVLHWIIIKILQLF